MTVSEFPDSAPCNICIFYKRSSVDIKKYCGSADISNTMEVKVFDAK